MEMAQIIETKQVAITREQLLCWLVEQGVCDVEINLNDKEGVVFIKNNRIKVRRLEKWAYFPLKDNSTIK